MLKINIVRHHNRLLCIPISFYITYSHLQHKCPSVQTCWFFKMVAVCFALPCCLQSETHLRPLQSSSPLTLEHIWTLEGWRWRSLGLSALPPCPTLIPTSSFLWPAVLPQALGPTAGSGEAQKELCTQWSVLSALCLLLSFYLKYSLLFWKIHWKIL